MNGSIESLCFRRRRRKSLENQPIPPTLTKIDNLDKIKNNEVLLESPLFSKTLNSASDKNLVRDRNKSPYSTLNRNSVISSNTYPPSSHARVHGGKNENVNVEVDLDEDLFKESSIEELSQKPHLSSSGYIFGHTRGMPVEPPTPPPRRVPMCYQTGSLPSPKKSSVMVTRRAPSLPRDDVPNDAHHPSSYKPANNAAVEDSTKSTHPPQNDLNQPRPQGRRFPVMGNPTMVLDPIDPDNDLAEPPSGPLHTRNLTSTPPNMYENISSSDNATTPQHGTPYSQRHLLSDVDDELPFGSDSPDLNVPNRSRQRRSPLPPRSPRTRIRESDNQNGKVEPSKYLIHRPPSGNGNRSNASTPTPQAQIAPRANAATPVPQSNNVQRNPDRHALHATRADTAPVVPTKHGVAARCMTPVDTQNLLDYCDELLADLQRVANS